MGVSISGTHWADCELKSVDVYSIYLLWRVNIAAVAYGLEISCQFSHRCNRFIGHHSKAGDFWADCLWLGIIFSIKVFSYFGPAWYSYIYRKNYISVCLVLAIENLVGNGRAGTRVWASDTLWILNFLPNLIHQSISMIRYSPEKWWRDSFCAILWM